MARKNTELKLLIMWISVEVADSVSSLRPWVWDILITLGNYGLADPATLFLKRLSLKSCNFVATVRQINCANVNMILKVLIISGDQQGLLGSNEVQKLDLTVIHLIINNINWRWDLHDWLWWEWSSYKLLAIKISVWRRLFKYESLKSRVERFRVYQAIWRSKIRATFDIFFTKHTNVSFRTESKQSFTKADLSRSHKTSHR